MKPDFSDVRAAAARLAGAANRTPVLTSRTLDERAGRRVFLKAENLQRGGAFKFRGAFNALSLLDSAERQRGVVSYSSGNHAQALALAGRILGVPATIVMPDDAPAAKVAATAGYGAQIVRYQRLTEDRAAIASTLAAVRGLTIIPPYDHPAVIAGQGTAALELLAEIADIDGLIVPVGGGGLIAGSSIAVHGLRPALRVFGVEPALADDTARSLAAGQRQTIPPPATIADGLRVTSPGELTFPIVQHHVEGVLLVSEDEIIEAVRFLLLRLKILVEPSGAVGVAALLAGKVPACDRVGVILSGGNVDQDVLATILEG